MTTVAEIVRVCAGMPNGGEGCGGGGVQPGGGGPGFFKFTNSIYTEGAVDVERVGGTRGTQRVDVTDANGVIIETLVFLDGEGGTKTVLIPTDGIVYLANPRPSATINEIVSANVVGSGAGELDVIQCDLDALAALPPAVGSWGIDDNDTPFFTWTPAVPAERLVVNDAQVALLVSNGYPYVRSEHDLPDSLLYMEFNSDSNAAFEISNSQTPETVEYVSRAVTVFGGEMLPIVLRTKLAEEPSSALDLIFNTGVYTGVLSANYIGRIANGGSNAFEAESTGVPDFSGATDYVAVTWDAENSAVLYPDFGTLDFSDAGATADVNLQVNPSESGNGCEARRDLPQVQRSTPVYFELKSSVLSIDGAPTIGVNTSSDVDFNGLTGSVLGIRLSINDEGISVPAVSLRTDDDAINAYFISEEIGATDGSVGIYLHPTLGSKAFVKFGATVGWVVSISNESLVVSPTFDGGAWIPKFFPAVSREAAMFNPVTDSPCFVAPPSEIDAIQCDIDALENLPVSEIIVRDGDPDNHFFGDLSGMSPPAQRQALALHPFAVHGNTHHELRLACEDSATIEDRLIYVTLQAPLGESHSVDIFANWKGQNLGSYEVPDFEGDRSFCIRYKPIEDTGNGPVEVTIFDPLTEAPCVVISNTVAIVGITGAGPSSEIQVERFGDGIGAASVMIQVTSTNGHDSEKLVEWADGELGLKPADFSENNGGYTWTLLLHDPVNVEISGENPMILSAF